MFLKVAKVLILNQIKTYRVHKFVLFVDALFFLSSALIVVSSFVAFSIPSFGNFMRFAYTTITSHVSIRTILIKTGAIFSAFLYVSAFLGQEFYLVSIDQYAILLHPVSFSDFVFGRVLSEAFFIVRMNYVIVVLLYGLTYIAGNRFSALAAFVVYIFGIVYFVILSNIFFILKKNSAFKALSAILLALSLYDLSTNHLTASYPIYLFLNAIVGCYTNYAKTIPFFLAFSASTVLLYYVTRKYEPEIERRVNVKKEKRFSSIAVKNTLSKAFVELRRSKILYVPLISIATYPLGLITKSILPNSIHYLSKMFPVFIIMFLSEVDYILRQEASLIWFYRITNSTRSLTLNLLAKGYITYFSLLIPLLFFLMPIGISALQIALAVSLIVLIVPINSIGAVMLCRKTKFRGVKTANLYSSPAVQNTIYLLYLIIEITAFTAFAVIALMLKNSIYIIALSVFVAIIFAKILDHISARVELG